jgi:hypothetical protein
MTALPPNYDAWRLQGPDDIYQLYIGSKDGDTCNRLHEPDEDAPRGYRPKPCTGTMRDIDGTVFCDTCREIEQ